ncbi:inositol monophosphatase [Pseudomonas aeruginosa]|nr:inositol monophosphatase [Pseudomonas aeruginosa]
MQPMLNIALRAARSAGELIFRSIERLDVISVNEKDAKDYVTEVDRAAEQTIVAALRKAYPTHAIMGEEGGFIEGSGEGGAALNGRRLRVSGRKSLEGALLGTGFPFRDNQIDNLDNYLNMFRSLVGQTAGIRRAGAASLDLAYVAAGRYDAFWEFGLSEWDMAAGALLVQEAGGLVSDFTGSHEFLEKGHIVAGNTKCFKALLTTIQPHLPPSLKR